MKTLFLLRHAKSSWDDPSLPDHDRPLNERGRRAAAHIAAYIGEHAIRPEVVLCSTARRALESLEALSGMFAGSTGIQIERDLYLASAEDLSARIGALSARVASVMVIGHNPGMHEFAAEVAGSGPRLALLEEKFPTGALAVLEFDVEDWHLPPGTGRLRDFALPRDLE